MHILHFNNLLDAQYKYKDIIKNLDKNEKSNVKILFDMKYKRMDVVPDINFIYNGQNCYCEYIMDNSGKPAIDFDCDVTSYIPLLQNIISNYYNNLYNISDIMFRWKYSIDDNGEKHFHCILHGIYIKGHWCEHCDILVKHIELIIHNLSITNNLNIDLKVDSNIYHKSGSLRMLYQYKYDFEYSRYCKQLLPLLTDTNIRVGDFVLGDKEGCKIIIETNLVTHGEISHYSNDIEDYGNLKIPEGMTVQGVRSDNNRIIYLRRIGRGWCPSCEREHINRPGMIYYDENVSLFCCTPFNKSEKRKYVSL